MKIQKPTVLVLGAGASHPYGLPLGRELVDLVLRAGPPQIALLKELGHTDGEVRHFHEELKYSGRGSVDRFLEKNPDFLRLGKRAIALALLPREDETRLFPPGVGASGDWYSWLVGFLDLDDPAWADNNLSIVTFNYDRSLEHYLCRVLAQRRKVSLSDAMNELQRLRMLHCHGSLGQYCPGQADHLDYGAPLSSQSIDRAASEIAIIGEERTADRFREAREVMAAAVRVLFLGFGYDQTNVRSLGIEDPSFTAQNRRELWGTRRGMTDKDWGRVATGSAMYGNPVSSGGPGLYEVRGFLQNYARLD